MSTTVKIKKIVKRPRGDKPGLVDIELIDKTYYVEISADIFGEVPEVESYVEAELELHSIGDYDLFKNEDEFMKEKEGSMAPQSIIPTGSFSIGQEGWKKSSEIFLNGKILAVQEYDDIYTAEIECLNVVYYAILEKSKGRKPEIGNIISSMFNTEMIIEKEDKNWS